MLLNNVFSRKYRTPAERAHCIREAKRHERRRAYEIERVERISGKMDARESGAHPVVLNTVWTNVQDNEKYPPKYEARYMTTGMPVRKTKRIRLRNIRQIAQGTLAHWLQAKYGYVNA